MSEKVRSLWEFTKSLWSKATVLITGGAVAAMIAVYFAFGRTLPQWAVWTLIAAAFYFAAFVSWDEQRKRVAEFKKILAPKELLDGLAPLLETGIAIQKRMPPLTVKRDAWDSSHQFSAEKWAKEVHEYLKTHVGLMAVTYFNNSEYGHGSSAPAQHGDEHIHRLNSLVLGLKNVITKIEQSRANI